MLFLVNKKRIMIGITTIVAAAINLSYLTPPSVMNAYRPSGRVRRSRVFTISSGQKKAFQERIVYKRAMVYKEGFAIGTMIFHKYCQLLAPSTLAE